MTKPILGYLHKAGDNPAPPAEMTPCPHCGSDLNDALGGYRTIGVYDIDKDRTVEWMCPDCGSRWLRGSEEDPFVTYVKKVRKTAGLKDGP